MTCEGEFFRLMAERVNRHYSLPYRFVVIAFGPRLLFFALLGVEDGKFEVGGQEFFIGGQSALQAGL